MNSLYGTRVAVLVGDFLFAQSSWFLANLDNLEVIKLISQVGGGRRWVIAMAPLRSNQGNCAVRPTLGLAACVCSHPVRQPVCRATRRTLPNHAPARPHLFPR